VSRHDRIPGPSIGSRIAAVTIRGEMPVRGFAKVHFVRI
jgi:hypothetical protein